MSWKDYLYFTNSQRRALILLLSLVLLLTLFQRFYFKVKDKANVSALDSSKLDELAAFKSSLESYKPVYGRYKNDRFPAAFQKNEPAYSLFLFNPNVLDSAGFVKLGLKPFMAHNILKYRSKGGRFRNIDAFSKVYGLSPSKFAQLKPYIILPEEEKPVLVVKEKPFLSIEINTADTSALKELKGIGSGLAKRIVAYRNKLGGFVSPNQLKEVWGISPELAQQLIPLIKVDASQIKKIPVNKSSLDRLRNHPYFNFYRAKAIYEFRKENGKIHSLEEMKGIEDESLTEEFWVKVGPYLEF